MAATLSLRQRLLWKPESVFDESHTLRFKNCQWQIKINKCEGSSDAYEIILKNYTVDEKFESFQVETFLEDRISNDFTHCSRLTISSHTEVLYRVCSDSIFPGFKTFKDLIVVCTFWPLTELMIYKEDVSLSGRRCLVWNAENPIPMAHSISPIFTLMDSKWNLGLQILKSTEFRPRIFEIFLECLDKEQSFQPFEVKVLLEDRRSDFQIRCSKLTVSAKKETLHRESIDSIYERLPALKVYDDVNVICIFSPSTELKL